MVKFTVSLALQALEPRLNVTWEVSSATTAPSGMSASAAAPQAGGRKFISVLKLESGAWRLNEVVMSEVAFGVEMATAAVV